MKRLMHIVILLCLCLAAPAAGQVLADFESAASQPPLYASAAVDVVANPDNSGLNPSDSVGYYLKEAGNWHYVVLDFPDTVKIHYNNLLTFKLRTSKQGRIFAKFYNGSEVLIENWCPNWNFQPSPYTWTECQMDMTDAQGKQFTQLHLAAVVDNLEEAEVWFDDVKLSNPDAGDGTPIPLFSVSTAKPEVGSSMTFDASAAYDYDGDIVSYEWDYGDGSTGTGKLSTHTYLADSLYHPMLTITDNDGKSAEVSETLFAVPATGAPSIPVFEGPSPETNKKIEALFQVKGDYNSVYDPDELSIDAEITYPDGSTVLFPCFWYEEAECVSNNWQLTGKPGNWMLRFISEQAGQLSVKLVLTSGGETLEGRTVVLTVADGSTEGVIRRDPDNRQYYRHSTGEAYYPLGINDGWDNTGDYAKIIANLSEGGANIFRYWHAAFNRQALEWSDNYYYDGLGNYSQGAAAMTDSLLALCGEKDVCMQLVIFQHGMFSENVDSNWDTNPYNIDNGGFVEKAEEFFYNEDCKHHAKKLLRYLVARYAWSPNLFAWEFFNEVQFTGYYNQTTAQWWPGVVSWHGEMSRYIEALDPWNHIQTTSAATNQLAAFDTIPSLDNVQYHIYEAASTLLQSQAVNDRSFRSALPHVSVINGEYGTSSSADMPFDLQRNAIWCGIMTQVPRFMWIWDHYLDPAWANLFSMPAAYLEGEELAKRSSLETNNPAPSHTSLSLKAYGMQSDTSFWGYMYDPANTTTITGATFTLTGMPVANYSIHYYYPVSGLESTEDSIPVSQGNYTFTVPEFSKGVAWKITRHSMYSLPVARAGNDTLVALGTVIHMDGSQSSTPYGGQLTYNWTLKEKPVNSEVSIMDPNAESFYFTPDAGGTFVLELIVSDNGYVSEAGTRIISVSAPPVAVAGKDTVIDVRLGSFTTDGSGSYDPEGDAISYEWILSSVPEGSSAVLYSADRPSAILEFDMEGEYKLVLTVSDKLSSSLPDTLVVTAKGDEEPDAVPNSATGSLEVWPNPAINQLHISLMNDRICSLIIFNAGGETILEKRFPGGLTVLNFDLPEEIRSQKLFLLKIFGEQRNYVKVLLLQ